MKKSKKNIRQTQPTNSTKQSFGLSNIDFKITLCVIAYLTIDFLPYFKSIEIIHPQFLYLSVVNIIVAGFIYTNPLFFDKSLIVTFKKSYVFWAYLAFIALCALSVFNAKNVSLGVVSITQILVVFGVFINLVILLFNRLYLLYNVFFLIGVSAFFQTFQSLFGFKEIAENQSVVAALASTYLKGNTGNINIFSASVLIKLPFVLIGVFHFKSLKKWFLVITLVLIGISVFLISARASLLSLAIIFTAFIIFYLKTYSLSKSTILRVVLNLILPLAIAFTIVNVLFKTTNVGGRFVATTERIQQIKITSNDGSINARYLFWKNAFNFGKEQPLLGIGLGNWRVESIPFEPKGGLDISLHAHNDFLEILAETGFVNAFLYFSVFCAILLINLKKLLKAESEQAKIFAFLALMLLVVYGIDSLFNFPFYRPTMQIGFCMLMTLSLVNRPQVNKLTFSNNRKLAFLLFFIAAIPLYFTYHTFKTSQLEYAILVDNPNIDNNLPTTLNGDAVINHQPLYPNVLTSAESFIEHAAVYYIYENKYDLAKKHLASADKINPYLATPDFLRYYISVKSGKIDSAYFYIKSSFYKRPSVQRNFIKAVETATYKKDTLELLKMYNTVLTVNKTNANWDRIYMALRGTNISNNGLNAFINKGLIDFPNDSLIIKRHHEVIISNYLIEGQRLFALRNYVGSLKAYHNGLKIDPTNVAVMQNIAFYYYNLGKNHQAIEYFLKALSKPGLIGGQTEFYLAQCYLKINDKNNACKYLIIAKQYGFAGAQAVFNQYCR